MSRVGYILFVQEPPPNFAVNIKVLDQSVRRNGQLQ